MSVLHNIFFFILAIGVLVTFHEFGHYWVARKAGVKVLRFSIGFGKPLLTWKRTSAEGDEIEYVIAAIPLGGYVKMVDEREGEVSEDERKRAFNTQPVSKRIAIVFAGPAFNFILAIVFYWVVFMLGTSVDRPLVGKLDAGSIAEQAGFENKDEVLQVAGSDIDSWNGFRLAILDKGLDGGDVPVRVMTRDGIEVERIVPLGKLHLLEEEGDVIANLGFHQWWPDLKAEIGGVVKDSPAEKAGLKTGDIVVRADNVDVSRWADLVAMIQQKPEQAMTFDVERDGVLMTLNITPGVRKVEEQAQGFIGAYQHIPESLRDELVRHVQYGPLESVSKALVKTWDMSVLTLRVLWKMVTGEAALANISGPITIATYAGVTASIGLASFLSFLAVISVSLGVLNLLPVPMLDGGHLLYYLIEIVKGSPVSQAFEMRGQQIGIVVLALLMSIAIFNDIQRLMQ